MIKTTYKYIAKKGQVKYESDDQHWREFDS